VPVSSNRYIDTSIRHTFRAAQSRLNIIATHVFSEIQMWVGRWMKENTDSRRAKCKLISPCAKNAGSTMFLGTKKEHKKNHIFGNEQRMQEDHIFGN